MVASYACLLVLIRSLLWLIWSWRQHRPAPCHPAAASTPHRRLLKPRTPDDCPHCRQERPASAIEEPIRLPTRSWSEVKRHRGRPKFVNTQGYACDNPACAYPGIADASIHALVGDGVHGTRGRIQAFRCQACAHTFSSRRHTPLDCRKTASSRVALVLAALAKGLDISAAVRVFRHSEATIARRPHRAGSPSEARRDHWLHRPHLPRIQLDEIRTHPQS